MQELKIFEKIASENLSLINNPFQKNCIERVSVTMLKNSFSPYNFYAFGSVEFKRNNTSGKQEFRGETFDDVALQIKKFIESEFN